MQNTYLIDMKTLYLLPLAAGLMLMACSKEESPAPDGGQGGV